MFTALRQAHHCRVFEPRYRPECIWQTGDDPERIGLAANALNKLLIEDEICLHVMERSLLTVWLESESHEPLRPGRRMSYIEPIVDSLKDVLSPRARKRLQQALSIVMGTEALIAVRDIGRASIEESLDTAAWAARALVRQALAEDEHARRKTHEDLIRVRERHGKIQKSQPAPVENVSSLTIFASKLVPTGECIPVRPACSPLERPGAGPAQWATRKTLRGTYYEVYEHGIVAVSAVGHNCTALADRIAPGPAEGAGRSW